MTDNMTQIASQLQRACAALSSQCDGAREKDGAGFNKPDSGVGNLIAKVPASEWTEETCALVSEMLGKYRKQLEGLGIESIPRVVYTADRTSTYKNLQAQVKEIEYKKKLDDFYKGQLCVQDLRNASSDVYCAAIQNEWFQLFSPRDQALINDIKSIQPWQLRKWNRDLMCWEVAYQGLTGKARQTLLAIIKDYDFVVSEEDMEVLNQPTEVEKLEEKTCHVWIEDEKIIFKVPFDRNAIADIKYNLTGRRFNGADKTWNCPASPENLQEAINLSTAYNWNLSKEFKTEAKGTIQEAEENIEASQAVEADLEIPGLAAEYDLYPFQKAGVQYALKARRVLIGDEMGLGKTLQGSATVVAAEAFPCLVICPKAVKTQWVHEIHKFFPNQTAAAFANGKTNWNVNFLVINYDILKRNLESLLEVAWKAIIIDESHYIKNSKTQRSKAVMELVAMDSVEYRIALTGTPVLNKPIELVPQLNYLDRMDSLFGGFWTFATKYCNAHQTDYGWDMNGAENLGDLAKQLRRSCFVRREKKEVFKELPALQRTEIECSISKASINKFKKDLQTTAAKFAERSDESARAEAMVEVMRLKRLAAQFKYNSGLEWVKNFLENGEKLVLFAHHRDIQDQLFQDLQDFNPARITGGDTSEKRERNVQKFWNDESCKVIVCSIKAANVGVNLQKASNVAFFEFAWHSGDMDQAEARVHRIGSEASSINSYWLVGEGTFDPTLVSIIEAKREIADAVNQGVQPNKKLLKLAKLDALSFFKSL